MGLVPKFNVLKNKNRGILFILREALVGLQDSVQF